MNRDRCYTAKCMFNTEPFPCKVSSARSNKAICNNNMCWSIKVNRDSTHLHNAVVWGGFASQQISTAYIQIVVIHGPYAKISHTQVNHGILEFFLTAESAFCTVAVRLRTCLFNNNNPYKAMQTYFEEVARWLSNSEKNVIINILKIRHYVKHNKGEGSAHDLLKLQQTA